MEKETTDLKRVLHEKCSVYVQERIKSIQLAIDDAQAAANDETKSSAGDKYETGRSMMQLEIEKNISQLTECLKLQKVMRQINAEKESNIAALGSVVFTNNGNFYLAISAGNMEIESSRYFAVSAASPIGQKLMGLKKDEAFVFNNKHYSVKEVI